MCLLWMKQIQIKIVKKGKWLVRDNRPAKLVTSTRHSCYVTDSCRAAQAWYRGRTAPRRLLSRVRPCPQPACSFVAQQAAANVTAGLALSRATDCKASGDTRAMLMWQNVLRYEEASCLLHYGKADCIALALVTTGHSLCGTTSHTENVQMRLVWLT